MALLAFVTLGGIAGCGRSPPPPPAPVPKPPDDMVTIPAGPFRAGCDVSQGCRLVPGVPMHPIHDATLPAFAIDRLEVSVEDYRACWRAGPCEITNELLLAVGGAHRGEAGASTPRALGPPSPLLDDVTDGRQPMWDASAYEARAYCAWVGKRLPTALEWEKAARGTDGRAHPWGNEPPTRERTSNAAWNDWPRGFPLPVGSQPAGASPYGVLDMVGNATEYVERDDGDRSGVLIAGGHSMVSEASSHGITVLPGLDTARGLYRDTGQTVLGFRCARSLPTTGATDAAPAP